MSSYADIPWSARASERLGHHASEVLIVAIAATIALNFQQLSPGASLLTAITLVGVVLMSWVLMRQHDRRLCEACMAAMPLNPARDAVRYRRRFWMAHTGTQPTFLVPYLIVLIGSNFAMSSIGRVGWALIQCSMIYLILASTTHRRLQPWCPWCQGGGGGQDVDETPPVLPHDDRQLV